MQKTGPGPSVLPLGRIRYLELTRIANNRSEERGSDARAQNGISRGSASLALSREGDSRRRRRPTSPVAHFE
jgi:hypothetical protein